LAEEEEAAEGWAEEVGVEEVAEDVVHLEVTPIRTIFSPPTVSTATCLCNLSPVV